jgi:large subunit ribosomal protein L25
METMELKARMRKESGKGPARRLRAGGQVPAVFYGAGSDSLPLAVGLEDLIKLMKEKKENVFIKLRIDEDGREIEKLSIIKEMQTNPATRDIFHADFYEIRMDHKLIIDIPIHIKGTPAGIIMGGELHILKRELKVSGLPTAIPEFVELDVSALEIGDSVKVGDIQIGDDIEVLDGEDVAVAAVSAAKGEAVAAASEEGAKEPEVITAKKKEA